MEKAKKFLTPTPFKVPKGIKLRKIDTETGGKPSDIPGTSMIEAFKDDEDISEENIMGDNNNEDKKHSRLLDLIDSKDENEDASSGRQHAEGLENDEKIINPVMGIY